MAGWTARLTRGEPGVVVGPAVKLIVAAVMAAALAGPSASGSAATHMLQTALAAAMQSESGAQVGLEPSREPPEGSGAEFTRYVSHPQLHNGFLAGGLVAWTSVLIGGLFLLEKRRLAALTIAGSGLLVGVALMFTGVT